jgi:hypothetical protein
MILDNIITICAIFGLAYLLKQSDGPWGIMAWIRNKLMKNKYVGVFFFKLLDCWYCTGCWAGAVVYLLHEKSWHVNLFILWVLAGGASSLILNAVLEKLWQE